MLWIVDGGMISLPVVARVEDFNEDSHIEITTADENHEWKSEPTRYEKVVRCKDCKHRGNDNECPYCNECGRRSFPDDDWFCADGARRQDGNT